MRDAPLFRALVPAPSSRELAACPRCGGVLEIYLTDAAQTAERCLQRGCAHVQLCRVRDLAAETTALDAMACASAARFIPVPPAPTASALRRRRPYRPQHTHCGHCRGPITGRIATARYCCPSCGVAAASVRRLATYHATKAPAGAEVLS